MQYYLNSDVFIEKHEKNIKRVVLRLKKYLAEPTEENIHDLRTAIRRLESSHSTLPKELRKKTRAKNFIKSYKKFFKINSDVRDLDVMILKLQKFRNIPQLRILLECMGKSRKSKLEKAEHLAIKLERLKTPGIKLNDVSEKKLAKRFEKLVIPLVKNIEKSIPIVTRDEKKIVELHRLRINCKKLRYLLELMPSDSAKSLITKLKKIQDYLGSIHDNDVLINYLNNSKQQIHVSNVINSEKRKRKKTYQLFVKYINSKTIGQRKQSSIVI